MHALKLCLQRSSALNVSLARQAMEADGVRADKQLLGALIHALGAGGLVDEAHAVFRTMARPAWGGSGRGFSFPAPHLRVVQHEAPGQ